MSHENSPGERDGAADKQEEIPPPVHPLYVYPAQDPFSTTFERAERYRNRRNVSPPKTEQGVKSESAGEEDNKRIDSVSPNLVNPVDPPQPTIGYNHSFNWRQMHSPPPALENSPPIHPPDFPTLAHAPNGRSSPKPEQRASPSRDHPQTPANPLPIATGPPPLWPYYPTDSEPQSATTVGNPEPDNYPMGPPTYPMGPPAYPPQARERLFNLRPDRSLYPVRWDPRTQSHTPVPYMSPYTSEGAASAQFFEPDRPNYYPPPPTWNDGPRS
jgi:hypothetical protein